MNSTETYAVLDEPVPNPRPDKRCTSGNIQTDKQWEPGLWIIRMETHTDGDRSWTVTRYTRYGSYGYLSENNQGTSALFHAFRPLGDDDPAEYHVNACLLDVFGTGVLGPARKDMVEELFNRMGIGTVRHLAEAVKDEWDKEED